MWALIIAAASPIVVAFGFWYTQRRIDRRELAKWRNEQLLTSVSTLLQLSRRRQSELVTWYERWIYNREGPGRTGRSDERVWDMELLIEQVRLLDERLAQAAEAIYEAHRGAENDAADPDPREPVDPASQLETLMVDGRQLEELHTALVAAFQKVTRMKHVS